MTTTDTTEARRPSRLDEARKFACQWTSRWAKIACPGLDGGGHSGLCDSLAYSVDDMFQAHAKALSALTAERDALREQVEFGRVNFASIEAEMGRRTAELDAAQRDLSAVRAREEEATRLLRELRAKVFEWNDNAELNRQAAAIDAFLAQHATPAPVREAPRVSWREEKDGCEWCGAAPGERCDTYLGGGHWIGEGPRDEAAKAKARTWTATPVEPRGPRVPQAPAAPLPGRGEEGLPKACKLCDVAFCPAPCPRCPNAEAWKSRRREILANDATDSFAAERRIRNAVVKWRDYGNRTEAGISWRDAESLLALLDGEREAVRRARADALAAAALAIHTRAANHYINGEGRLGNEARSCARIIERLSTQPTDAKGET